MANENFNYTTRDFSTVKAELLDRATRALPEWTDRNSSDFMMALIDLWSYAADVLHFYVDRAAGEAFLPTATQRESVMAFANLYDYIPNPVSSAAATVTVYNSTAASVTLPAGTNFSGSANGKTFNFYSLYDSIVYSESSSTLSVKEGVKFTDQSVTSSGGSTTSNGLPRQQFTLFHKNVDPLTISVNVYEGANASAVEWRRVAYLSASSASDSVYTVYTAADGTVSVIFGNGVNGRIPPTNVSIRVTYSVTSGADGNVPVNAITSISSSSYPGVRVLSSTAGVGGTSAETIESMKTAIPRAIRSQGRAVTLSDFADLALKVSGVAKVTTSYAVGPSSTGGSVTAYVVPYQSGYSTSASTATTISVDQYIRDQVYIDLLGSAMLGVASIAVPSTITLTNVFLSVDLYVKENYVQQWVETAVSDAITAMFDFSKVSFGQVLTVGEFYRTILAVDGVDYAIITDFNTTGIGNGLAASGKITINDYQLPRKGVVSINSFNGVAPPA